MNELPTFAHLWQRAASLAARAHAPQYRSDNATPYYAHAARVALTLTQVFGCSDERIIAAALLHDVIEDTTIDYDDILEDFGHEVADLVAALSKDPRMIEAEREAAYDAKLSTSPSGAKLIKLADVYDNLCDSQTIERLNKQLPKVRRALAIAEADATLAEPVRIVRELADTLADNFANRLQTYA